MTNLLSRKFIFAIMLNLMGFVLVLVNKVQANDFLTFAGVVGATYVLGNVGSAFANRSQN